MPRHTDEDITTSSATAAVMRRAFRIESRGATLDGHFTHQTRMLQVP
jgi:hypothetical protein